MRDGVARAHAGLAGGRIVGGRHDLDQAVRHVDLDAEPAERAALLRLHIGIGFGIQISRMRIECADHAADGRLQDTRVVGVAVGMENLKGGIVDRIHVGTRQRGGRSGRARARDRTATVAALGDRIRRKCGVHAVDRAAHQPVLIRLFDVIGAHMIENLAEHGKPRGDVGAGELGGCRPGPAEQGLVRRSGLCHRDRRHRGRGRGLRRGDRRGGRRLGLRQRDLRLAQLIAPRPRKRAVHAVAVLPDEGIDHREAGRILDGAPGLTRRGDLCGIELRPAAQVKLADQGQRQFRKLIVPRRLVDIRGNDAGKPCRSRPAPRCA